MVVLSTTSEVRRLSIPLTSSSFEGRLPCLQKEKVSKRIEIGADVVQQSGVPILCQTQTPNMTLTVGLRSHLEPFLCVEQRLLGGAVEFDRQT